MSCSTKNNLETKDSVLVYVPSQDQLKALDRLIQAAIKCIGQQKYDAAVIALQSAQGQLKEPKPSSSEAQKGKG